MNDLPDAGVRDPAAVRAMFGRIARRYDLANHLLSAGLDFSWRKEAVRFVRQWQPAAVLDVATGSGDLALELARALPQASLCGVDLSPEMLEIARRKGLTSIRVADAQQLPFPDESFDVVTVAFGLRNMADRDAALSEMRRVLRPVGHLLILDFSLPRPMLRPFYRFYLHRCVPLLAGLITGEKTAYEYLGASIETFPHGAAMCRLLQGNGFSDADARPLTGGIVTIYSAGR